MSLFLHSLICPIDLFVYLYTNCMVLVTVALYYVLKSCGLSPLTLFFLFKTGYYSSAFLTLSLLAFLYRIILCGRHLRQCRMFSGFSTHWMSVASFPTMTINMSPGCQYHGSVRCHSFLSPPPPQQQRFGIHPQTTCLCGICGIQHHMPSDPGGVSPTCALGNRHTHLSPGHGPCSGL